jgi:phytoene/squalene synthetase
MSFLTFFVIFFDLSYMQKYIAQYGTSYRLANYFFPQEIKDAVIVLYAFVRVPDNVVDSPDLSLEEKENLFAHQESMMWSIFADKPVAALRA